MATGVYPRKPLSEETKARIGAANRGKKRSVEVCVAMSEARKGKRLGPYSLERGAAISAAKLGVPQTPAHREANRAARLGYVPTADHRAALSAAGKGRKRPPFSDEWKQRIGRASTARTQSAESNKRRSVSLRKAYEDGRKSVSKTFQYTSLARALHAALVSQRGLVLEPEIQFGRFRVDLYDRANHIAYEADGKYWHDRTETARPGYAAARDAYLFDRFGLSVVHYADIEIKEMTKRGGS